MLVAGGGVAAAELLLALRSLAEDRVELELVAPSARLPFRPAATATALDGGGVPEYDLQAIASDTGARFRRDTVEAVAPDAHRVRLALGDVGVLRRPGAGRRRARPRRGAGRRHVP